MEGLSLKPVEDIKSLIDGFCGDCKLRDITEESIRRYRSSLLIFASYLAGKGVPLDKVDLHVLRSFLQYVMFERN